MNERSILNITKYSVHLNIKLEWFRGNNIIIYEFSKNKYIFEFSRNSRNSEKFKIFKEKLIWRELFKLVLDSRHIKNRYNFSRPFGYGFVISLE